MAVKGKAKGNRRGEAQIYYWISSRIAALADSPEGLSLWSQFEMRAGRHSGSGQHTVRLTPLALTCLMIAEPNAAIAPIPVNPRPLAVAWAGGAPAA